MVRRVVTGHRDGKAVFASDEEVQPLEMALLPGSAYWWLWGADEPPTFPDDGGPQKQSTYLPLPGGFRFCIVTLAPDGTPRDPSVDVRDGLAELEEKLPGVVGLMERESPGMHTTDTVDFEVVLSGELLLELDDGEQRLLRPGDTVVQNGTRHRWINPSSDPATMAVFNVGAHRKS